MRILVAYGSKTGGTKRLAEMLGADFKDLCDFASVGS